jgi:hypothetical protein
MPQFEVTTPDGRKFRITAPEGASKQDALSHFKQQYRPQEPELPPTAETSWTEYGKDIGRGVVRGVTRGVEAIPAGAAPLLGAVGHGVEAGIRYAGLETPEMAEEIRKREERGKAIDMMRAGSSPSAWVNEHVQAPVTQAGKMAESVAGFAPSGIVQPGGWLTKFVTTIGGGVGAELGEEAGGPWGGFLGAFFGNLSAARLATATQRGVARLLMPSSEQNASAAKVAYQEIGQAGLGIEPSEVQNFAAGLRADLSGPNHMFTDAPGSGGKGFRAADQIEAANGDLATILNVHSTLGKTPPSAAEDYVASIVARDTIREWVGSLQPNQIIRGDPQFIQTYWDFARDSWRAHSNLEELKDIAQSAYWRRKATGTGTNLNTFRQEVRRIIDNDNKARRYSEAARTQMEDIVTGGFISNLVRRVSKFAPHGPVSSLPTLITGTAEPSVGTAIAVLGTAGHLLSHVLENSTVRRLEAIIRSESPLTRPGVRRMFQEAPDRGQRRAAALARTALSPGEGSALAPEEGAEP